MNHKKVELLCVYTVVISNTSFCYNLSIVTAITKTQITILCTLIANAYSWFHYSYHDFSLSVRYLFFRGSTARLRLHGNYNLTLAIMKKVSGGRNNADSPHTILYRNRQTRSRNIKSARNANLRCPRYLRFRVLQNIAAQPVQFSTPKYEIST